MTSQRESSYRSEHTPVYENEQKEGKMTQWRLLLEPDFLSNHVNGKILSKSQGNITQV